MKKILLILIVSTLFLPLNNAESVEMTCTPSKATTGDTITCKFNKDFEAPITNSALIFLIESNYTDITIQSNLILTPKYNYLSSSTISTTYSIGMTDGYFWNQIGGWGEDELVSLSGSISFIYNGDGICNDIKYAIAVDENIYSLDNEEIMSLYGKNLNLVTSDEETCSLETDEDDNSIIYDNTAGEDETYYDNITVSSTVQTSSTITEEEVENPETGSIISILLLITLLIFSLTIVDFCKRKKYI